MPYCQNCGTQLQEDAQYCYKCGTATTATFTAHNNNTTTVQHNQTIHKKSSSKPIPSNFLFILILLTLIITIIAIVIVVASLSSINLGIDGRHLFKQPEINRIHWNIPKITKSIFTH